MRVRGFEPPLEVTSLPSESSVSASFTTPANFEITSAQPWERTFHVRSQGDSEGNLVQAEGVEPSGVRRYRFLKPARLPVPPCLLNLVRMRGVEPPVELIARMPLKHVRLPIPPHPHLLLGASGET